MFFVPPMLKRLYAILGDVSLTAIATVARPVPPGPVAITVSIVETYVAVGVPDITPVDRLNEIPKGNVLPPLKE